VQDGAKWFRSTAFGDEKDRVVQRENGLFTYFASDIAYHANKYERGFDRIIDIWGADHHGYIPAWGRCRRWACRPRSSTWRWCSLRCSTATARRRPCPPAPASSSPCASCAEVGNDACRFFYVLRKADQHLDFDLDLAKSQSNENPVYYIQYAHARLCSVLGQWNGVLADLAGADLARLDNERELALCARLTAFPKSSRTPRLTTRRTRSPSTSRIWPVSSTATTTPSACWWTTKGSSLPVWRWPLRASGDPQRPALLGFPLLIPCKSRTCRS
jgi:arginyl-tRNA synthetase